MAEVSKEELLEHLKSIDLNDLLDRMENYVRNRFYSKEEAIGKGVDYLGFCNDVLLKALEGIRNWNDEKCSFEEFIFGALKSDLYNFFRKNKKREEEELKVDEEVYLIEVNDYIDLSEVPDTENKEVIDYKIISEDTIKMLEEQNASKLEIEIFKCWLEGYNKPKDIAYLCEEEISEVYIAIKKLTRKTIKIRKKWEILKK